MISQRDPHALATHVINEVATVSSQSEQLVAKERGCVATDRLNDGHDEGCGDETNPLVMEEGERFRTKTKDDTRSQPHSEEERREG